MDIALWVAAGFLAVYFAIAGGTKLALGRERAIEAGQRYGEDLTDGTFRLIGVLEVAAAVGLVLPALLGVAPMLVPVAASGLVAVMIGAVTLQVRRQDPPNAAVAAVLGVIAAFVAWGRFGDWSF